MLRRLLSGALVLAALTIAVSGFNVSPAHAQGRVFTSDEPWGDTGGAGADSTTITIGNSAADTTAWIDLVFEHFPTPAFAGYPLIKVVCNTNAAVNDSIGFVVQYSTDKTVIFSKAKAYFVGASPQVLVALSADTNANDPAFGFRYIRFILSDDDYTRTQAFANLKATIVQLKDPQ